MANIECDDQQTASLLARLLEVVESNGGYVHPDIVVRCQHGDLSIHGQPGIRPREIIISLPRECLIPVDNFQFKRDCFEIEVAGHNPGLSEKIVELMHLSVALYNATGKLKQHMNALTLRLYEEDPIIFGELMKGLDEESVPHLAELKAQSLEHFLLPSYLYSRVLRFRDSGLEPANHSGTTVSRRKDTNYLMPVIDFLNHHPNSQGFITSNGGRPLNSGAGNITIPPYEGDGVAVSFSTPIEESSECFVAYGPFDARDLLLIYNYVEPRAFFVKSIPIQASLPGGWVLDIRAGPGLEPSGRKLPSHLEDLRYYIPEISVNEKTRRIRMSFVSIPLPQAPLALRRVLTLAMSAPLAVLPQDQKLACFMKVERLILEKNAAYYRALLESMASHEVAAEHKLIAQNIVSMAEVQLANVRKYPFWDEAMTYKAMK